MARPCCWPRPSRRGNRSSQSRWPCPIPIIGSCLSIPYQASVMNTGLVKKEVTRMHDSKVFAMAIASVVAAPIWGFVAGPIAYFFIITAASLVWIGYELQELRMMRRAWECIGDEAVVLCCRGLKQ